jgi:GDPmannose 4,6-dehydratase
MKALIVGVSGQDGSYLAQLLLDKGYEVWGTSRDAQLASFVGLQKLGILNRVKVLSMSPMDFRSTLQTISNVAPDEIYNLSGQSSVGLSFEQPVETTESISTGVLNLLECIRFVNPRIKFYNAGSSEVFGDIGEHPATETTPFRPRSPYAVAKAAATWEVAVYRSSYGIFACTGILFNHESPLRPTRFVTKKIITTALRIARGSGEKLTLGNITICRDWGWAPEYVHAMWLMMNQDEAQDFVIGTGQSHSLKSFVEYTFSKLGMDWHDHVIVDRSLIRPLEIMFSAANAQKAKDLLGWSGRNDMFRVIDLLLEQEDENFMKVN